MGFMILVGLFQQFLLFLFRTVNIFIPDLQPKRWKMKVFICFLTLPSKIALMNYASWHIKSNIMVIFSSSHKFFLIFPWFWIFFTPYEVRERLVDVTICSRVNFTYLAMYLLQGCTYKIYSLLSFRNLNCVGCIVLQPKFYK